MNRAAKGVGASVAVGSLIVQALTSLALVIAVARLLPAAEYTSFSLCVVTAFFLSTVAFEWVRLSVIRQYPGPADGREGARLSGLRAMAGAAALVLLALVGPGMILGDYPASLAMLTVGIAALQGATDVQQAIMRSEGRLLRFGLMQMLRAGLLLAAAVTISVLSGRADAALLGMAGVHLAVWAIGQALPADRIGRGTCRFTAADLWQIARYGVPIAAASSLHGLVAITLRWVALPAYAGDAAGAAGFSMAMDLFQKPFPLLGSMIASVAMPALFAAFDRGTAEEQRRWMRLVLNSLVGLSLFGCLLLIAIVPAIAELLVQPDYRPAFIAIAPWIIGYFALLLNLQTTLALVPQIRAQGMMCLYVALAHAGLALLAIFVAAAWNARPEYEVAGICIATAIMIAAPAIRWARQFAGLDIRLLAAMGAAGSAVLVLAGWVDGYFGAGLVTLVVAGAGGVAVLGIYLCWVDAPQHPQPTRRHSPTHHLEAL